MRFQIAAMDGTLLPKPLDATHLPRSPSSVKCRTVRLLVESIPATVAVAA